MFFELFLCMRYLKARRKQAFISLISVISIVGIMVGVMSLIVVISVMNGFRKDLTSKILGVKSHISVQSYGGTFTNFTEIMRRLESVKDIKASTPSIESQGMIKSTAASRPVYLRGIETSSVTGVIDLAPMIKGEKLDALNAKNEGMPSIIIGSELAANIGAGLESIITLVSPEGKLTPLGRRPNEKQYRVTGLFNSGMYEYDIYMAFISLREAQDFLGIGNSVSHLEIRVKDPYESDLVRDNIIKIIGNEYRVKDWKNDYRSLLEAMEVEKIAMFVILIMIVMVGALNIISTLVMIVMEKTRDVAILRAMGAARKSIMSVFIFQGLFVGLIGTLAGLFSGLGICWILSRYKIIELPQDVYYLSTLPVSVEFPDVLTVIFSSLVISFLATIYPSWYASRLNPVEALRYE